MPVWSPYDLERGAVIKRWNMTPKSVSYKTLEHPWQCWYNQRGSEHIIIVEDQLSAARLWQLGHTAVALLGTGMAKDKAEEIAQTAKEHPRVTIKLALDHDAFAQACKLSRRYASLMTMLPVLLNKDIKDTTDDDIRERVFGRTADSRCYLERQESV
jgi:hypothetical protein